VRLIGLFIFVLQHYLGSKFTILGFISSLFVSYKCNVQSRSSSDICNSCFCRV